MFSSITQKMVSSFGPAAWISPVSSFKYSRSWYSSSLWKTSQRQLFATKYLDLCRRASEHQRCAQYLSSIQTMDPRCQSQCGTTNCRVPYLLKPFFPRDSQIIHPWIQEYQLQWRNSRPLTGQMERVSGYTWVHLESFWRCRKCDLLPDLTKQPQQGIRMEDEERCSN